MNKFMQEAIKEAKIGINNHEGGPFGTIIVKDGNIIGRGHNKVIKNYDPTCHGEIDAIRNACQNIKSYDLSDCELYTTGEPCVMCLCACLWANISKVYYGATIADNSLIGFRDSKFDSLFNNRPQFDIYLISIDRDECLKLFVEYQNSSHQFY